MAEGGARVGAGAIRTMGILVFSFVVETVAFAGDLSSSSNMVVAVAATSEATAEESSEPVRRLPSGKTRPSEPELAELERSDFLPIKDRWRIGYTGRWWDPYNQNVLATTQFSASVPSSCSPASATHCLKPGTYRRHRGSVGR